MTNVIQNGSFEQGWETEPQHGNQIPHGWALMWSPPGDTMLSAGAFPFDDPPIIDIVQAVPECVHKHYLQLPPNEWPGADDALILEGEYVYKVFGHAFSATLAQNAEVEPGALAVFVVPVQVHHHGDGSPGACAFRIRLNGVASDWITFGHGLPDPANPEWVTVQVSARAAYDGLLHASIDIEGRAEADVSFFIDAAELLIEDDAPQVCRGTPRVQFDRTFVLFPEDATIDQFDSLVHTSMAHGHTFGRNADDAGMGDLDNRHVLIVWASPSSWAQADIEAHFTEHYPGVTFEHVKLYGEPDPEPPPDPGPQPPQDYNYPVVATGPKVFTHSIGEGGTYDILSMMVTQGATLPFCKLLATNPSQLAAVVNLKALSPDTRFVVRLMQNENGHSVEGCNFSGDPAAYMALVLPSMLSHPDVDYWELWNEEDPPGVAGHVQMAQFAIACMDIADAVGVKLALMSYSTGVPEFEEWQAIADQTQFFQKAQQGGHILSLHAYGRTDDAAQLEYHLLRPVRLYSEILEPRGLVVPYIFTEYNVAESAPGVGVSDWPIDALMDEYAAFDNIIAGQYYCLGASLYSFGMLSGGYNLNSKWTAIAGTMLAARDRSNATP